MELVSLLEVEKKECGKETDDDEEGRCRRRHCRCADDGVTNVRPRACRVLPPKNRSIDDLSARLITNDRPAKTQQASIINERRMDSVIV